MGQIKKSSNQVSRRRFLGLSSAAAVFTMIPGGITTGSLYPLQQQEKPESRFGGVQIGAISYSWRSMPCSAEDILKYCIQTGISSVELMGDAAEKYAGLPPSPPRPASGSMLSDADIKAFEKISQEAAEAQRNWRINAPIKKFKELRDLYKEAGVNIHIAKFSPEKWSEKEIEYSFRAAKALGAIGVSNEIGDKACQIIGPIAQKYGMFAIFHQHLQPGEPGWSFDKFLNYSPANMLNFDVGHYYGATGLHPNGIIEKHHDRIKSIHLKDKTGPDSNPANTNMPWGKGDTPIADILLLIKNNKWPINVDIELEYPVPEGSDAVTEVRKCVDYCRDILLHT
jgi:sugar phosphate isomerase/epimerase